ATPLSGITAIPESSFTGTTNGLFASEVQVEVFGKTFMPAYTQGDNSQVVATATMTNFILQKARLFAGATQENFLYYLAQQMLTQYPQKDALCVSGKELPFVAAPITGDGGTTISASDRLFAPAHDSYGYASFDAERDGDSVVITDHA